jgi:hypothetical protein
MIFATLIACAITITASIAGQSQQSANPSKAENKASDAKSPVEVLNYKIVPESYEKSDSWFPTSPMAAENGDIPTLPGENRNPGTLQVRSAVRMRGLDSKVTFKVVIKNNSAKPVKVIEWDFMYPNCENGQVVLRHIRTSKVNVPTGGQKTIIGRLSLGKDLCKGAKVDWDDAQKQERVSIKRIEYMDGSVWQRK